MEYVWNVRFRESGGRKLRNMRRCAADFWQMRQIFQQKSWRWQGLHRSSRMMIWKDVYRKSKNICCLFCDDKKIKRFHHRKKIVTIQIPIRKTAAIRSLSFTHVITSPYKLCQMALRMHAFDVHIVIIYMALNSYHVILYP